MNIEIKCAIVKNISLDSSRVPHGELMAAVPMSVNTHNNDHQIFLPFFYGTVVLLDIFSTLALFFRELTNS